MTSTKPERIAYLQEKGPHVDFFNDNREVSVILLRDGKEQRHTFLRNTIDIVFPHNRLTYPIPEDGPDYFIYVPSLFGASEDKIIPLSKDEAEIIAQKIRHANSVVEAAEAAAAEAAAAEADKECVYCGEKLGECNGDHEYDDDRASVTSAEMRVNAHIVAAEAAMNGELQEAKQSLENDWAASRKLILARHEALRAEEATKQLEQRMRIQEHVPCGHSMLLAEQAMERGRSYVQKMNDEIQQAKSGVEIEWASGRERILAIHKQRAATEATKY